MMKWLGLGLTLFTLACGVDAKELNAEIEDELNARLLHSTLIVTVGCASRGIGCGEDNFDCGEGVLERARMRWEENGEIVIWWESHMTEAGRFSKYWFVDDAGHCTHYFNKSTDIGHSDCGDYCGWHKEDCIAGDVVAADGVLVVESLFVPGTNTPMTASDAESLSSELRDCE